METTPNPNDKKSKRPRIGEPRPAGSSEGMPASSVAEGAESNSQYQRPYQPRYNQPGGYQPRYNQPGGYKPRYNQQGGHQQGGYQPRYNQPGGYQPRPYQPRPDHDAPATDGAIAAPQADGTDGAPAGDGQRHYQPRYNQQGGYQPRYNNGGYQPRYNNGGQQGGYKPRYNQQGGQQQGGYKPRYNQQGQRPMTNQYGMPKGGKSFTPRPKPVEYEQPIPDPNEQVRLNKYMANAGICSRREADEFITQGLVKVNGNVVTELGTKITCADVVEYDDKVVTLERKTYILLNKPKDCVTTSDDPNGRTTVLDLVKGACTERIYPVGRLDRNTTGVLLLTNDGDLASKLTHPKYIKKKIYHVWTDKDISEDDMQAIADGIELDDGPIHADAISYATENDRNQAGIEIHSGRNRIVRRIFEKLGYRVTKLDRVYFAGLTKKNLPRGRWRYLTQEEVNFLKMGTFE